MWPHVNRRGEVTGHLLCTSSPEERPSRALSLPGGRLREGGRKEVGQTEESRHNKTEWME